MSCQSLRRFIIKRDWRRSKATVRMEDTPTVEVAEADAGRLGAIIVRPPVDASLTGPRGSSVRWEMVCHPTGYCQHRVRKRQ